MSSFGEIASRFLGFEDKFVDHILDPIHGQVGVTKIESCIIKTDVFSRLKDIKQLGFVSNIYPSATHTRFEHSIGTLFVTWEMLKRFATNYSQGSGTLAIEGFPDDLIQATRLAALLHDLGHGPYSHGIEEAFPYVGMKFEHDELTNYLLTYDLPESSIESVSPNLKTFLLSNKPRRLMHFRKELGKIKTKMRETILGILNMQYKLKSKESAGFFQLRYFLHDLLKGDVGSDRVDYLLRDTYFTGLGHRFSLSEILDNVYAIHDRKRNRLVFAIQHPGRDAVELMLLTRYFHYQFIAHHPKNVSQIVGLIPRLEEYLLKMKDADKSPERTLIRIALETDWIERKLPRSQGFKKLSEIRLSEIKYYPFKYLLYRLMTDQKLRKILLREIMTYLSNQLKSFSPNDVIFYFSAQKSHIPIIHVHFDKYVEKDLKKSVLIHDESPFLIGLGRAYLENSSFMTYARGRTCEELEVLLNDDPYFFLKKSIFGKVMQQLDTKNLNEYDLLLLSLTQLTNGAKISFKGFGNVMRIYDRMKKSLLDSMYEFSESDICYDPYWNTNFYYPISIFNDLLLFDVCRMFRMEITSVPYHQYHKPSWEFAPVQLMLYSKKLHRQMPTHPARVLLREFYPDKIIQSSKKAMK